MKILRLTEKEEKLAAMQPFLCGDENSEFRKIIQKYIETAIDVELTERQKYCIVEHYLNKRTMTDIADKMGVNVSTVSKHIKRGIKNIKKHSKYVGFLMR